MSLTTTQSPFIESARNNGELFIRQPYELYSEENHQTWNILYNRMLNRWNFYACDKFLEGIYALHIDTAKVPRLEDINEFLKARTGFVAKPVSGYIPATDFFKCLSKREFPTTITVRSKDSLDYIPEPDIFHDICGHVPMHTDKDFADTLVEFGECSNLAEDVAENDIELEKIRLSLARFFWYSIEFGLMKNKNEFKVYGSGLLSSYGEIENSITSKTVQIFPFQTDWIINQSFDPHHYQSLLFYIEDFSQLFDEVKYLIKLLKNKKLNNVYTGK